MLIKGADVIGAKVIAEQDKKELGKVKDLVYDSKKNKVIALLLTEGGILAEAQVVPFSEIKDISKEAVVIKSPQSLKPSSEVVKPMTSPEDKDTYMQETTIQSKEGKNLGKENDIFFDTSTGQVQKFEVQDGQEMHEVKVADIVSSDSTKTVVKTGDPQQNKHKESEGLMEKVKHIIGK